MYHSNSLAKRYYITKNFSFFTSVLRSSFVLKKLTSSCNILINNLKLSSNYFGYIFQQLASIHFNEVNSLYPIYAKNVLLYISNITVKVISTLNSISSLIDRTNKKIVYEPTFFHYYINDLLNPLKIYFIPLDYCVYLIRKTLNKISAYTKTIARFNNSWCYTNKLRVLNRYYPVYFNYSNSIKVINSSQTKNLLVLNNLLNTCTNLVSFYKKKKKYKIFILPEL